MKNLKALTRIFSVLAMVWFVLSPTSALADRQFSLFTNNLEINTALEREPGSRIITIVGHRESVSSVVLEDVAEFAIANGVLPIPGCIQLEMVSTSVNDTAAGSGARIVEITYLDGDGFEVQEIVSMNGTTPVLTVATDICNIQYMYVEGLGAGATGTAQGDITLQGVGAGTVYELISAGGNQSLTARYKMPRGKVGIILDWKVTGTVKEVDFRLRAEVDRHNNTWLEGIFLFKDIAAVIDNTSPVIPILDHIPEFATVKISAISSGAGTGTGTATFRLFITDKH